MGALRYAVCEGLTSSARFAGLLVIPSMLVEGSGGLEPFLVAELARDPRLRGVVLADPSDLPELHIVFVARGIDVFKFDLVVSGECGGHGRHSWRPPDPAWVAFAFGIGPRLTA